MRTSSFAYASDHALKRWGMGRQTWCLIENIGDCGRWQGILMGKYPLFYALLPSEAI